MLGLVRILLKSVLPANSSYGLVLLGLLILILGALGAQINVGINFKFSQDVVFTIETLCIHLACLFIAYRLIELNPIFILSQTSRQYYVYAIFCALIAAAVILSFLLLAVNFVLYLVFYKENLLILASGLWLLSLSGILFGVVFITIANVTKSFWAFIYSSILFFAGSASSAFLELERGGIINAYAASMLFWSVPNFGIFNLTGAITSGAQFDFLAPAVVACAYFILYAGTLVAINVLLFKRKKL